VAILKYTKGQLALVTKTRTGSRSRRRSEALERPPDSSSPCLLPPPGTTDGASVDHGTGKNAGREIKEWQAIMNHLRNLPVKDKGELPVIPVDALAAEVRQSRLAEHDRQE